MLEGRGVCVRLFVRLCVRMRPVIVSMWTAVKISGERNLLKQEVYTEGGRSPRVGHVPF